MWAYPQIGAVHQAQAVHRSPQDLRAAFPSMAAQAAVVQMVVRLETSARPRVLAGWADRSRISSAAAVRRVHPEQVVQLGQVGQLETSLEVAQAVAQAAAIPILQRRRVRVERVGHAAVAVARAAREQVSVHRAETEASDAFI